MAECVAPERSIGKAKGRPRGRPFQKGTVPNPAGRPKGVLNKATREIRESAKALLEDPEYVQSLRTRLIAGTAPHMETKLHDYAYGRPKETVEMTQRQEVIVTSRPLGTDPLARKSLAAVDGDLIESDAPRD